MRGSLSLFVAMLIAIARVAPAADALCPAGFTQEPNSFQVGLEIFALNPNRLPDFLEGLPIYGPVLGVPVPWGDLVQLQASYGSYKDFSLYTIEGSYRVNATTPYFNGYLAVGAHILSYSLGGNSHRYVGGNVGLGLSIDMSRDFDINIGLKTYIQESSFAAFGGGFRFLL